jgi:signal transduction histidine kinase
MKRKRFKSLTLITALLVLAIAILSGTSLFVLSSLHSQFAHLEATRRMFDEGRTIATYLAQQPVVRDGDGESGWGQFSTLISSIHAVENGLQYVSVKRDGVTVFHEQTSDVETQMTNDPDVKLAMDRKLLTVGKESVAVVTFTGDVKGDDGTDRSVEIALKKDTVRRSEGLIKSMFRLSLLTTVVSFSICLLLVVLMMHREVVREKQRREEEHLVFAGVLADGIVHDFRNPMSSMQLDVQLLQKELTQKGAVQNTRVAGVMDRILRTMGRMDKVFQEFFYLSKPGTDTEEKFDLAYCIRECVNILAPGLEQAGIKAELALPDAPLEIRASQTFLRRAIVNLITNAKQFSKSGDTVHIRLSASGRHAIVDVIDNGPGVPASERKSIFDMFVTTRPGGIGLGLFLAKTAVENSGGTIKVVDRPEGGSCFRITLPLAG